MKTAAMNTKGYFRKRGLKRGLYETFLLATVFIMLAPFIWALILSVKPNSEIYAGTLSLPAAPAWENFVKAWTTVDIPTMAKNTLIISVITMSVCIVITVCGAFAIARIKFGRGWLQKAFYTYFIIGLIIPVYVMIYPVFKMNTMIGVIDNLWGVILPYIGWSAPMNTLILVGAFRTVPDTVEEAAIIDGCSPLRILLLVDVPIIRSAITTVLVINFLGIWNEFAVSVIMLTSPGVQTISLVANKFVGIHTIDYGAMAAAVVMLAIPQVLAFSYFQRFIVADLTAGAVKE